MPSLRSLVVLTLLAGALGGCHDFSVPEQVAPVITDLSPEAAYADTVLEITGKNFDPVAERNAVLFAGGMTVLAHEVTETGLRVYVPEALQDEGPVSVTTSEGMSEPSAKLFYPLGTGHPIFGTAVADVRFRHRPVGLFDSAETVLLASTLFEQLVDDAGGFVRLDGRAVAFARAGAAGQGLVSVRTADGMGVLLLVDGTTGETIARSEPSETSVESVILSGASERLLTVGVSPYGLPALHSWSVSGESLTATETDLPGVTRVLGGAVGQGGESYLVATSVDEKDQVQTALYQVGSGALTPLFVPDEETTSPTGALALVETAGGTQVALGMADGDLLFVSLADGTWRHELLVSYGQIGALQPGVEAGKVVLTKPDDGSAIQYDVGTGEVDWTVQIRGEPTVLDVAADLDEVAVGNAEDNGVDIVQASTGLWLGRISFGLGLGSADRGEGGSVAPYSYDPRAPERTQAILVLARAAGMVLSLDASSLDLIGTSALDPEASEPLRLAVTHDLRTVVLHRDAVGLLEEGGERIVASGLATPTGVAALPVLGALPEGGLVLGSPSTASVYRWSGTELSRSGGVSLPDGATLAAVASHVAAGASGAEVLVVWSTEDGYGGGVWDAEVLAQGGVAEHLLQLPTTLGDFLGVANLADGPALAFGRSGEDGSPAIANWENLLAPFAQTPAQMALTPSAMDGPVLSGASPDGRFLAWLSERQGVSVARLLKFDVEESAWVWTTYQLAAPGSGPTFDPSGQWMYVPVPKLDQISVFQ